MQEDIEAVLERQTVLGKFLDRLNYRTLRYIYTLMSSLLSSIDRFLSSNEDSLYNLRTSLLSSMSLLARTFYQSSLVDYLKSGSRAAEEFKEEVERAFLKGMSERELIVQKIDSLVTRSNDLFRLKEETNNQWQDVYYRTSTESTTENNIRNNLALVLEKQDEYNQLHKSGLSDLENIQIQKDLISQTTDLSFQAIDLADKAQMTLHEMLVICINPLVSIFEDEISSADKILSQIQLKGQKKSDDLSDDEIGKLCDVLSWGLDDINNYDELTKLGKEFRNEFATILSDFLVYLVDIDLGIQELESFILESSEK
ncbi:MAG: hypothetical protein H7645_12420 [Candidatus Heimdallarchaeota archaeon]|nr:hypothetical protein [Candidatus Heimdallarchaeota archaeon]MCK4771131.1 hypothetical protein [Candidatus Heimdallarchaeota archaeon]